MVSNLPRLMIAGVTSGVGKTTFATGIMAALIHRQRIVQPFKVGPDYIDPSYHTMATGRPSRNLDSWMIPEPALCELFSRAAGPASISIIEGVMGLFDGHSGGEETGSSAHIAKMLHTPVLLVVDVARSARSVGAVVLGFQQFDRNVQIAGVLLNRVGSANHLRLVTNSIQSATGLPVVGYLPRRPDLALPERHLGLIPTAEGTVGGEFLDKLVAQIEETVDLVAVERIAKTAAPMPYTNSISFPPEPVSPRCRIALARDEAFSFYYEDSLDLLSAWGAELAPFSPLRDSGLPAKADGVYLGGGFPELFAGPLAGNEPLHRALRQAASKGMPIYGECGGLMYLLDSISDLEGNEYPMVGLVPGAAKMVGQRLKLAYVTARARRTSPLLVAGDQARGHEFHWSELHADWPGESSAYDLVDKDKRIEGYLNGNLLASYVHLHFGANPRLAPGFVDACARWRDGNSRD